MIKLTKYKLTNDDGFWCLDKSYDGDWYKVSDVSQLFNLIVELEQVITKLKLRCEYAENIVNMRLPQNLP